MGLALRLSAFTLTFILLMGISGMAALANGYEPLLCREEGVRVEPGEKIEACPCCGSAKFARILYGKPAFTDKLKAELEAGTVILGGCLLSGDDPFMACADCKVRFYRSKANAQ